MPKFILLNGPPRCGKDTAAKMILNGDSINFDYLVEHEKFSTPLKECFAAMMQVDINDFVVEYYEDHKEEIIPTLGVSFRQWQIDFSEKFMKPLYGNDVFGRLFMDRIKAVEGDYVFVVSDCGFQVEVDYLIQHANRNDVLLIKLHRQGCDFKNDSREYVLERNVMCIDVNNNASKDALEAILQENVQEWLNG